jgi:hypothetical protein
LRVISGEMRMAAGTLEVGDGRHKPMIFEGFPGFPICSIGHNHVCGSFSRKAA